MVRRNGLIGVVWREREIPAQCSKCWTKILGIYMCVCVCVWHEWGSVGYFEWVGMYDGANAEAKSLMGKGLFMTD